MSRCGVGDPPDVDMVNNPFRITKKRNGGNEKGARVRSQTVGLIGLGNMGNPIGMNLLKSGIALSVYDISRDAMEALAIAGAHTSSSPKDLASRSDTVILMVPGPEEVEEVCLGADGVIRGAREGAIVIDMTTSIPAVTRRVHDSFVRMGIQMIDAPVSGGVQRAIEGTLSIMVGGELAIVEAARPILERLGKNIYHLGPIGSGHLMKVINNFLFSLCMAGMGEALGLAVKQGLEPLRVLEVLQTSSGSNYIASRILPEVVLPGKPSGYACSTICKDLGIFIKISQDLKAPTFMANLAYALWSVPEGKTDGTEFYSIYEDWFKVKIRGITDSSGSR